MSENYQDCGVLLYDIQKQDMHAGASGCGCSASVLCGYLLRRMAEGHLKMASAMPLSTILPQVTVVILGPSPSAPRITHGGGAPEEDSLCAHRGPALADVQLPGGEHPVHLPRADDSDKKTPITTYPVRILAGVSLVLSMKICPMAHRMPPHRNAFYRTEGL